MESTPGKHAVKTVEVTTKDYITQTQLIKQQQGLRGLTPNVEVLLWVRCYQTALHATKELRKEDCLDEAHLIVVLS